MKFKVQSSKFKVVCLWLILLLAAVLRLWKLDQYPAGLNADEAAIGYNAYSLIMTGKDEHGDPWPIHFKSFGDYKPGLYFYLVVPFVKFLGLNVWAVRLPSAILGIFSVWLIYLLAKERFKDEWFGLISAFFLAISPWHLHFSRGGWETNGATFFILVGVYLFLKALDNPKFFVLCSLFFVLSLYTYHSARMIVPLLSLGLLILHRKEVLKIRPLKWLLICGGMGLVLMVPLGISFLGPAGVSRFAGVGLLADTGPFWRVIELRSEHGQLMSLPVRLLHNRFTSYILAFFENWLDHFHGEFLFLSGDVIERNRVPESGQMYLFDIPFVLLGVYFFLKNKPKGWQVVFFWLAVAPVAAAMTFQTPHALRAHNMVVPLIIISAYGLWNALEWSKDRRKIMAILLYTYIAIMLPWNFARYLHQYYVHYPKTYPFAWEYGFEEVVNYVQTVERRYEKIYVTDRYDQPYILFLFYFRYPPEKFQQEVVLVPRDKFGFSTVRNFDKFYFGAINWEELKKRSNLLVIGTEEEIPADSPIIKTIYFRNGEPAFRLAET